MAQEIAAITPTHKPTPRFRWLIFYADHDKLPPHKDLSSNESLPMSLTPPLRTSLLALIFGWLMLTPGLAQNVSEEAAFQEAERYYAAGIAQNDRFEKGRYMTYVIGLYTEYLRLHTGSKNEAAARFHFGYARQTMGNIAEAKDTYKFMITRHRRGAYVGQAARQMAYLAFVEENWEEAAKYFSIAATHLGEENLRHSALTKEVECLLKLDRDADVSVALRRIIETPNHPHKNWAIFILGFQYFQADKFETTIQTLKPLLDDPEGGEYRSQAVFYTGLAAAELGHEDVQDSYLRTVLEMSIRDPSLTPDQRRHLATNKAKAQTSLMGLYSKKKDWDTVIELYEKGDFGATGKIEARRCMRGGKAYRIRRQYLKARACYRRVDRALPETDTAFLASFRCLECDYHLRHPALPERVDIFFDFYAKKYGRHTFINQARFFKGETLFARRALEEAALAFNKVDRKALGPALQKELLFKHGWCLSESGQFDGATRSFSQFLADFPDDARAAEVHNKRAQAHLALGDYTSALQDFEAVLANQTHPEQTAFALQGSARVLRHEKKFEVMVARYRRILQEFPTLSTDTIANANYWIGWGFYKLGEFKDAPPYLRKSRDLVPEFYSQPAGDLLILSAFNMRDKLALHQALQEVFAQAPEKSIPQRMLSWLGVQMFHDGEITEAANYLEKATDPEVPERSDIAVWRILAKSQNRSGRYSAAQETSLLLLEVDQEPRWKADAYLDLAEARLGLKLYPETLDAINKGLAVEAPGSHIAGLHIARGEVALAQELWSNALEAFKTAIPIIPDDPLLQPRALYGAQIAATNLGNKDLAAEFQAKLTLGFSNWKPVLKLDDGGE